jgi:hypothetical protein
MLPPTSDVFVLEQERDAGVIESRRLSVQRRPDYARDINRVGFQAANRTEACAWNWRSRDAILSPILCLQESKDSLHAGVEPSTSSIAQDHASNEESSAAVTLAYISPSHLAPIVFGSMCRQPRVRHEPRDVRCMPDASWGA